MSLTEIKYCPGTLAEGFDTYNRSFLNRMFQGKKVHHVLPYYSPTLNHETDELFEENQKQLSISGVQEKFSVILEKNKLRLVNEGEKGTYILKPIPSVGKKTDQMPPNEHLTMQIARQVYSIDTAENALIFFKNGAHAYITKRFDIDKNGNKLAQEDFASLAGRTPQTHGEHYKYLGNYLELFQIMQANVPAYKLEATKLLKALIFNYLFSNGDAHFKNFSLLETSMGDFRLSPMYDLLNSRIHINDNDF
ncbi:MAG: HipA domain-containing protein, partial [Bacteroidetes bacterium]|nr:HipA domain-containing protein [Bacteroidota bacterium]